MGRASQPMWDKLIQLSFRSKIGLQAQIREMLVAAILDGHLPAGIALPSTRELAAQLGVARNTVALAYELLVQEGYLVTRSRSGHYVSPEIRAGRAEPGARADAARPPAQWRSRFRTAPSTQRNIVKPKDWQKYPYPFVYGQIDPALTPVAGWRECVTQALSVAEIRDWSADLIDGDDPLLIEQIQTRLLARRGIWATPEEILVTVGAQQALYLLSTLLTGAETTVGVEDPGYPDARNIFAARPARVVPLPLDDEGLALSPALDACEYVYVTPSYQCPTSVTMPLSRRQALIEWADRRDRVLIEDDYEIEMGAEGRAQPALKSLDAAGRVVYVGSLSKTLAPGIRLGYIVGSRELIVEARALRRLMLRHPAANNQRSVALFLAMGYHDALLRRIRQTCAERAQVVAAALASHLPQVRARTFGGASSCWLRFPDGTDTRALAAAAERRGVLIEPGDVFFAGDAPARNCARLGFASIATDRIAAGVREVVAHGHDVIVEHNAGRGIGMDDDAYRKAGAKVVRTAAEVFKRADMIVKVKEPQAVERKMLRKGQILFTYLHLAPDPEQAKDLVASGAVCIAYETVTSASGGLPLLAPMSEVAGRMAVQAGAYYLEKPHGGLGMLLGGVPGVDPAKVVILGGGVVGSHACHIALGMGAEVWVLDRSVDVLRALWRQFGRPLNTVFSTHDAIENHVTTADLVIGGVLIPGASAPKLVSAALVRGMKKGSVIVDVAIDQGGCFETSRPTTHAEPVYVVDGVTHYCVANMPGGVPRTSTFALNNATLPFVLALAAKGWKKALADDPHLMNGLNVAFGKVTCQPVAEALGYKFVAPEKVMG